MQNLAEKFRNPQSRGEKLQFIKLRQIHPSYIVYTLRLVHDYLRVAKVTNNNLDC